MKTVAFAVLLFVSTNTVLAQDNAADTAANSAVQEAADTVATAVVQEGEAEMVEAVAMQPAMMIGAGLPQMLAAKRFQLTQIFAVEVEEIKRVCELDDAQVRKLSIGAKGAVKKLMHEWKKTADQQFGVVAVRAVQDMGEEEVDPVDNDQGPINDETEVEITDADQIDYSSLHMVVIGNNGNTYNVEQPAKSEFWKKTIGSVLTESQATRLDQFRMEREAKKRSAMTALCLSTLDLELGLNDEQHLKLSALVTPLTEKAEIDCSAFMEPYLYYYHASKADEGSLKEFLSAAQIQKWKLFMAPTRQIGQMIEMEAQGARVMRVQGQAIEIRKVEDDK